MTEQALAICEHMERAFATNEPNANRRNILLHALEVFVRKGIQGARIQDIAERAGFSQGYVYRYFRSKEDIFTRLVELAGIGAGDTVRFAAGLELPAWERLLALAQAMLAQQGMAALHWRLNALQASAADALPAQAVEAAQRTRGLPVAALIPLLQEAQRDGDVVAGEPLMLSIAFFSVLQGLGIARTQVSDAVPFPPAALVLRFLQPITKQEKGISQYGEGV